MKKTRWAKKKKSLSVVAFTKVCIVVPAVCKKDVSFIQNGLHRKTDRKKDSVVVGYNAVDKVCGKLQGSCAQLRLKHCEAVTAGVSDAAEIFMSAVP